MGSNALINRGGEKHHDSNQGFVRLERNGISVLCKLSY